MKVYLDITLLPSQDINLGFLWEKMFQQVHLAIVEKMDEDRHSKIGISFPEYNYKKKLIGRKLRLFADNNDSLECLNINQWLSRMTDYLHITSIRPVPNKVLGYVFYKRHRMKTNLERLVRRKAKRAKISEEEARKQLTGFKERHSDAPFINIKSLGTGQRFKLFIVKQKTDSLTGKTFGSYGFGLNSSVPEF